MLATVSTWLQLYQQLLCCLLILLQQWKWLLLYLLLRVIVDVVAAVSAAAMIVATAVPSKNPRIMLAKSRPPTGSSMNVTQKK